VLEKMLRVETTCKHRHRCENNIKWHLKEIGWGTVEYICLAEHKVDWQAVGNGIMQPWVS